MFTVFPEFLNLVKQSIYIKCCRYEVDSLPGGSANFDRAASASALDVDEEDSSGKAASLGQKAKTVRSRRCRRLAREECQDDENGVGRPRSTQL